MLQKLSLDNRPSFLPTFKLSKKAAISLIALVAIGSVVGVGIGLAALGAHRNFWKIDSLKNFLSENSAIIMLSTGGAGIGLSIFACIINYIKNRRRNCLEELSEKSPSISQLLPTYSIKEPMKLSCETANASTLSNALPVTPKNCHSYHELGCSYSNPTQGGIADLAYCSGDLGFGCVVDGSGHNNKRMRDGLLQHFDPFIQGYAAGLPNQKTFGEFCTYFSHKMQELDNKFRDQESPVNKLLVCPDTDLSWFNQPDPTGGTFLNRAYKPAMSFAQVVVSGDRVLLFTAQALDTMVVVEMEDGNLYKAQHAKGAHTSALGDQTGYELKWKQLAVKVFDITGAKRVLGLSDGISEFMTFEELNEITKVTKSSELFSCLKDKVVNQKLGETQVDAANGCYLKKFDSNQEKNTDDMSLFVLDLE